MRSFCLLAICFACPALHGDQIQMKNGDRVSGKIVTSDAKSVTVKSEFFGEVKIDRAGIVAIQTDTPVNVTLKDGLKAQGTVSTEGGLLRVQRADQPAVTATLDTVASLRNDAAQKAWEREQVRLTDPPFTDFWAGVVSLSLANTSGNSRTRTVSTSASATRATGKDKLGLYFGQVYATQSTTTPVGATANRISGGTRYERNLAKRLFSFSTADFDYDRFQDLDLRSVLGGGLGLKVWKGERGYFDLGSGGAWNREKFGTGLVRNSGELLFNQELAYRILNRVNLSERMTFYPNLTQTGEYRLNFDTTASVPVFKWLEWAVGVNNRFLSNPLPGRKTNDMLVTTGVRFAFDRSK